MIPPLKNNQGFSISPIDGRYHSQTQVLKSYFSELAITKKRILIELEYLIQLGKIGVISSLSHKQKSTFKQIIAGFNEQKFAEFKKIEAVTGHDIKAIEYYLQSEFKKKKLDKLVPYLHFGLTSDDVNNLAYAMILRDCNVEIMTPLLAGLLQSIRTLILTNQESPILARTHGQPAVPTTFGKEMANYYLRIKKQLKKMQEFKFEGKCNGAVGNYNSLDFVFPKVDWIKASESFIKSFGLIPNYFTTQILPYDNWLEYFQIIALTNMIIIDLSTNIWQYIMLETLQQKKVEGEVGSSTMPQKVNPINFENAEGNLQIAFSYFEIYLRKLPLSRLQRDLSDSTVRRTFGEAFGYTLVGWKSCQQGLRKISLNREKSSQELQNHWEILGEAIQTYLRTRGDIQGYEKLKLLTRGELFTEKKYREILKKLKIEDEKCLKLRPEKYLGLAKKLTKLVLE